MIIIFFIIHEETFVFHLSIREEILVRPRIDIGSLPNSCIQTIVFVPLVQSIGFIVYKILLEIQFTRKGVVLINSIQISIRIVLKSTWISIGIEIFPLAGHFIILVISLDDCCAFCILDF